ncbi:hypothetical protein BZG36_03953 [Bifiguratus adelaidae]|uniref:TRAF-type domain-containing protein n=1 Tax=Bifiguratus adelaidae TaxID=1938954 RepID=A0A261XZV5_9FUNG|nr:hypothetical protein BZG36_03953 [Bifiguratus adelaidae]
MVRSWTASPDLDQALAGFSAGMVSTGILHPLDLVKVRFQVDETIRSRAFSTKFQSPTWNTLKLLYHQDKLPGLYRGLTASLTGATMSWAMYFWGYSKIKRWMRDESKPSAALSPWQHLVASELAGLGTAVVSNPVWVIKTRMCTTRRSDPGAYRNVVHGLVRLWRDEGIRGYYRGMVPALFGTAHGALQFMAYEEMKKWRGAGGPDGRRLENGEYLVMAAGSKIFAAVVTYPYQVLRARLQNAAQKTQYTGTMDAIRKMYRAEGLRSFYKGVVINVVRVLPGTCLKIRKHVFLLTLLMVSLVRTYYRLLCKVPRLRLTTPALEEKLPTAGSIVRRKVMAKLLGGDDQVYFRRMQVEDKTLYIPKVYCPYPLAPNPYGEEFAKVSNDWLISYGVVKTRAAKIRLHNSRYYLIAAHTFPMAQRVTMRNLVDLFAWFFSFDDLTDDMQDLGKDPAATQSKFIDMMAIFDGAPAPKGWAYAEALHDLWTRICADSTPRLQQRFKTGIHETFDYCILQAIQRETHAIPTVEEYIPARRAVAACLPFLSLLEMALRIDLPDHVFHHPIVQKLNKLCGDHVAWANDVVSFRVEYLKQDYHNLVAIVFYNEACSIQQAIYKVCSMIKDLVIQFEDAKKQLPSFGDSIDQDLPKYIAGLETWMSGNLHWSWQTGRYHGANYIPQGLDSGYIDLHASKPVGAWVIFSMPAYVVSAGIIGLVFYALACGIPILTVAYVGGNLQTKFPQILSLGDFVKWRFGRFMQWYVAALMVFNMAIGLCAEYTAMGDFMEYVIGTSRLPMVILIAVITSIYTAAGGLYASILTDVGQSVFSFVLLFIIYFYVAATFRPGTLPPLNEELGPNYYGYATIASMPISLIASTIFSESYWQRIWASDSDRALKRGAWFGCIAIIIVTFMYGFGGFLSIWANFPQSSPDGSTSFFDLLTAGNASAPNWILVIVAAVVVTMNEGAVDSYQNGITDTISAVFFRHRSVWVPRALVFIINVPLVVVSLQGYNINSIFLIGNMLSTISMCPILLGLSERLEGYVTAWSTALGMLMGFFSVMVFGTLSQGSVSAGMYYCFFVSYDWPSFVIPIIASVVGVFVGVFIEFLIRRALGLPFPVPSTRPQELERQRAEFEAQKSAQTSRDDGFDQYVKDVEAPALKPAATIINNMVNELLVYCPQKEQGCVYSCQRQWIGHHLREECLYVFQACQLEECHEKILKKDLSDHVENCPQRKVECALCHDKMRFKNYESHRQVCPAEDVQCQHCKMEMPRGEHEKHLLECQELIIPCLYADLGCSWTGLRKERGEHLLDCLYEKLKGYFAIQKSKEEAMKKEIKHLRASQETMSHSIAAMREDFTATLDALSTLFPSYFRGSFEGRHDTQTPLQSSHEILFAETEQIKNEMESLQANLASMELKQNVALMTETLRLQEEIQSLRALGNGLRMQMHYVLMERRNTTSATSTPNTSANTVPGAGRTGPSAPGNDTNVNRLRDFLAMTRSETKL